MALWEIIAEQIGLSSGEPFHLSAKSAVGGGCINSAYRIADGERDYFVKLNSADTLAMFEAEAEGLNEMAAAQAVRVPLPLTTGLAGGQAFIVMEALSLGGAANSARLGWELAALHRISRSRFGWHRDNTIGSTPQYNDECEDWIRFWREQRLGAQLQMAAAKGYGGALQRQGERLLAELPAFFSDYTPLPSLLHGDLWSGNHAYCRDGTPVIFDPAVYFGDREADIAMTELFGGFGGDFYAAYNEAWPLDPGYAQRKTLYNLYHILNHLNLFGGGYGSQAQGMIERLLAELRG
jgi:fructosamine-3-kinase